jgi:hypothetical protein
MRDIHRALTLAALAAYAISCGFMAEGCGGDSGGGSGDDGGVDGAADGITGTMDSGSPRPDAGRDVGRDTMSDAQADNALPDAKPDNATPDAQGDATTSDAPADNTLGDAQADSATPDAQGDATTSDAPADNTVSDAGADTTVSEAGPDGVASDALLDTAADSGFDAGQDAGQDAGMDAGQDAGMDAGMDAGGDAPADSPADVGPDRTAENAFAGQVATALCNQIALCCFPDGGTAAFNMAQCTSDQTGSGYQNSSLGAFAIANGNTNFDPNAGGACLGAIGSIANCTVTAALQPMLLTNCFGAYLGTLGVGAPCAASMECAAGQVCAVTDGGPTGACAPLRGTGQPCGDRPANPAIASEFCSYRGSGNTGRLCNQMDDAGNSLGAGSWTCQPQYPVGAFCNFDTDCVPPQICDLVTGTCVSTSRPLVFVGTGGAVCPAYTLDGGGGG